MSYYSHSYQEGTFQPYRNPQTQHPINNYPQREYERYRDEYRDEYIQRYQPFQHDHYQFQNQQFHRSYQMDEPTHPSHLNQMHSYHSREFNHFNQFNQIEQSKQNHHQSMKHPQGSIPIQRESNGIQTAFNTSSVSHTTITSQSFNEFSNYSQMNQPQKSTQSKLQTETQISEINPSNQLHQINQNVQINQNNQHQIKNPFAPSPKNVQKKRPIYALTLDIHFTYKMDQSLFTQRPKKYLTKITETTTNKGKDNANHELIVAVDEMIGSAFSDEGEDCYLLPNSQYTILTLLGSGTFGQVFKCRDNSTNTLVAVKILKSKPVFFRQGMLEIAILTALKDIVDVNDKYHTVKMNDYFLYHGHVCIVFELLSVNLYEMLKSNKNFGMGLTFNRHVLRQLLESLHGLTTMNIIHCDVKTENILLIPNTSDIKLIDFGSACFEKSTLYTYIQSRHYRAPEIILGLPYTCAIDMWSFGCVIAELMLGIPIFPGENEYNQLKKIITIIGMPPKHMLDKGKKTDRFFKKVQNPSNPQEYEYVMRTGEEFSQHNQVPFVENRRYHQYNNLQEFCCGVRIHRNGERKENDDKMRAMLFDFLSKILVMDPEKRMTPDEAAGHPLMKGRFAQEPNFDWIGYEYENVKEINLTANECAERIVGRCPSMNSMTSHSYSVEKYYQIYTKGINKGIILNVLQTNPFSGKPLRCFVDPEEEEEMNMSSLEFSENDLPTIIPGAIPERSRSKSLSFVEVDEELPSIGIQESKNVNIMKRSKKLTIGVSSSYSNSNSFFQPMNGGNGMNQMGMMPSINGNMNPRSGNSTPRRRLMTPTKKSGDDTLRPPDDGIVRQAFGGMKHPMLPSSMNSMNTMPMMQQQNQQSQFQSMMHPLNGQPNQNSLFQRTTQPNLPHQMGNQQMQMNSGVVRHNSMFMGK